MYLTPCDHCLQFNLNLVIPHSNVTNIFPEVTKIQGLIVKMKISLDYSANTEHVFHSVLSHKKAGFQHFTYFLK